MADATAKTTLGALRDSVFSIFGNPLVVISDNGTAFANKLMQAAEKLYGYRQIFALPHTPQANGLAEAAVKKLKIMLDRHTFDYHGWHQVLGMAQSAVNQRVSSTSKESPFAALFGRQPITLSAMENPSLLPAFSSEEKSIKELAYAMTRLHRRLQEEVDAVKDVAAHSGQQLSARGRTVQVGDKVWLTYSDQEKARYIRKHGHGAAWRHAFEVDAVKPHAVRLIVPKDGTVPDVLPWQSLRKCSFAAPYFHSEELPIPDVDDSCTPVMPDSKDEGKDCTDVSDPAPDTEVSKGPDDDLVGWTADRLYDIERIVSAERVAGGWKYRVKWTGYDTVTPEPQWKLLKQVTDPEILEQMEQCKSDFLDSRPAERTALRAETERQLPTRVQPARERSKPDRLGMAPSHFTLQVSACPDSLFIRSGLQTVRSHSKERCRALRQSIPDFQGRGHVMVTLVKS